MRQTKWQALIDYICSYDIGSVVTRQNILNHIEYYNDLSNTVDSYINILKNLGIIETISPGIYKILYHIKKDISKSKAQKSAYSGWGQWFNDFKVKEEEAYQHDTKS